MTANTDILLVDDDDSSTEVTLNAIHRIAPDLRTLRLKDGDQALQFVFCTGGYAGRASGMPRLILLEVGIPFISGLQVLDALRGSSSTSRIPVVMLSSTTNPAVIVKAYDLGAKAYVVKQVDKYNADVDRVIQRWRRGDLQQ